ncbi:Major Facilitator Superfamily protein [Filimonas lacunae]|uniref:Major Facilitator Superfamily protein n=1 Tax=Filimonas lacunae TaxID=477680 RepID=A0A173MGU8_9BACT|nr:MFS transporter [Filimonas lacunae]BAV06638.1 inner membrane component of tripartite multidrug resistance system [Filimonas lacunae]SIT27703.1 Major Facilitator Superfamily protein [Filimonas lacunae]
MNPSTSLFKAWVPLWLAKIAVFLVLFTTTMLLAIGTVNVNAAAGYYGVEPADISYTMLVFYAALVSFIPIERRLSSRIQVKHYLVLVLVLNTVLSLLSYASADIREIYVLRFMHGFCCGAVVSVGLGLIFRNLNSERAREIGYSLFYCMLLTVPPFTSLVTTELVDTINFNKVYLVVAAAPIPGFVLLYFLLSPGYLGKRKIALYQFEWHSFVFLAITLLCIAYVFVYGQEKEWLEDAGIVRCIVIVLVLSAINVIRQRSLKRPFLHIEVFKARNFCLGALLLVILYIARGALNITTSYFSTVVGMDPFQLNTLMIWNMVGAVTGVFLSSRMLLALHHIRRILFIGFTVLFAFHGWMYFLFSQNADVTLFPIPLFMQGLGAGLLITPIVLFTVSAVPQQISGSAAMTGMAFRFFGTSLSTGLVNYFQMDLVKKHYDQTIQDVTLAQTTTQERLNLYKSVLSARGMGSEQAGKAAYGLLNKAGTSVSFTRFAMDYYWGICAMIVATLLLVMLSPVINKTWIQAKQKFPIPSF